MFMKEKNDEYFMQKAIEIAKDATCSRSKCASIIVKDNQIIGKGFNSPANNLESQRRCSNSKSLYNQKVTDKTCCVHAEQRALLDALKNNPKKIENSVLYFIRIDLDNNMLYAGKPYCTICSKMALDLGVSKFVLYHREGIIAYDTKEYNDLSYNYQQDL